jgi:hypothetical protein
MSTNTGELRETLIECIEKVKAGKMSASDAKAVAMLAAQVTMSLQVEVNVRREEVMLGKSPVGQLALGMEGPAPKPKEQSDDTDVIEAETRPASSDSPFNWRGLGQRQSETVD